MKRGMGLYWESQAGGAHVGGQWCSQIMMNRWGPKRKMNRWCHCAACTASWMLNSRYGAPSSGRS